MSDSASQPKSIRSIRRLRKSMPKTIEDRKQTIILRGSKTSHSVTGFMKDIRSLRKESSMMYSRHHDIKPFEDHGKIEQYCEKTLSSLFLFGSHSKKKPNNIVLGRTYEHKILDIVELGLVNYTSIFDITNNCQVPIFCQPFVMFQGDLWETVDEFKKLRNLLHDFFYANQHAKGIEISKAMKVVVCFTITEDRRIHLQVYETAVDSKRLLEEDCKITIQQLGPNAEFVLRRFNFADSEMWKQATHVPKPKKKKQNKNVKYDSLGNKRGKLYVDHQNLKNVPVKRRKLITKQPKRMKKTQENGNNEARDLEKSQKHEDEFAH